MVVVESTATDTAASYVALVDCGASMVRPDTYRNLSRSDVAQLTTQ